MSDSIDPVVFREGSRGKRRLLRPATAFTFIFALRQLVFHQLGRKNERIVAHFLTTAANRVRLQFQTNSGPAIAGNRPYDNLT